MNIPTRPNILFMLSEDPAVQAFSALNRGRVQLNRAPHVDRIADEGAVFRESFCCTSICTSSRVSILPGKHSMQNGVLTFDDARDAYSASSNGVLFTHREGLPASPYKTDPWEEH